MYFLSLFYFFFSLLGLVTECHEYFSTDLKKEKKTKCRFRKITVHDAEVNETECTYQTLKTETEKLEMLYINNNDNTMIEIPQILINVREFFEQNGNKQQTSLN